MCPIEIVHDGKVIHTLPPGAELFGETVGGLPLRLESTVVGANHVRDGIRVGSVEPGTSFLMNNNDWVIVTP